MPPDAPTIKAAAQAAKTLSDAHVYPAVVSFITMALIGLLLYWQRMDMKEQRVDFLAALQANTATVKVLSDELHRLHPTTFREPAQ